MKKYRLSEELGNIDEAFLEEVLEYKTSERSMLVMTRNFKRIAMFAAVLVLCIGIVGAAAFVRFRHNEPSLKFLGFDTETGEAMAYMNSEEGLKVVSLSNLTITDENGEEISKEYDKIVSVLSYWADENGDMHFVNIPVGVYKIEGGITRYDDNGNEIIDSYEFVFDSEDWPYDIFPIDPREHYAGSVEEGTAYIADSNDISVEFVEAEEGQTVFVSQIDSDVKRTEKYVDTDKGDKVLKITVNSDVAPFNDIQTIGISNYLFFDENHKYAYGDAIAALLPLDINHASTDFDWGLLCQNNYRLYALNNGKDQGRKCTIKIYAFIAELSDGTVVEIQGDWVVNFTV